MYGIKEFMESYQEKELAEGLILALSEPVSYQEEAGTQRDGSYRKISAEFVISNRTSWRQKGVAEVCLDLEHGELVRSFCSCLNFENDGYACKHTIALQASWLLKNNGAEYLRQSPLNELLIQQTGCPDPFAPGIMRKTHEDLKKLITGRKKLSFPHTIDAVHTINAVHTGEKRLELHAAAGNPRMFELKLFDRRAFVVKDITEFLQAFQNQRVLTFGKTSSFPAMKELFDEPGRKLLEYLSELYEEERSCVGIRFFFGFGGSKLRYLQVSGRYYDGLMELVRENGYYDESGNRLHLSNEACKVQFELEKLEYGAVLRMEQMKKRMQTKQYWYLQKDDTVYRLPYTGDKMLTQLLDMAENNREVYVSDQDLPEVCRQLLEVSGDVIELQSSSIVLESFRPKIPAVKLYMDLPQQDLISCRPVAVYEGKEYPLALQVRKNQNRNPEYEQAILMKLMSFFQAYHQESESCVYQGDEEEICGFLSDVLPMMESFGAVFISDELKKRQIRTVSRVTVGVSIDGGLLNLNMKSQDFSKEELMEILCSYKRKKKFYRLKNGSFVRMEEGLEALWNGLADCVKGLRKPEDGEWKLPLFRAMYLDEMLKERDGVELSESGEYRRLLEQMEDAQNFGCEPPAALKEILRNYQTEGFRWLKTLKYHHFGGILADEMGLGKTLQVLAFLLSEKESGKIGDALRTIIITPASLIYNWQREITRYAPDLTVKMIAGNARERQRLIQEPSEDADVWITSYDLLKRDILWYEDITFANQILDEAQYIKNQNSHAAHSVRLIRSEFRMALTGTPIENRLSELWSIFDYLMPGFLFSYRRFREEIELPVVSESDEDTLKRLRAMVHPFILRRLKKDVLNDLPDKLEKEISVPMNEEQQKLYDAYVQRLKNFLAKQTPEEFANGKLEILAELTKLRQLCCNPAVMMEDYSGGSAKLDASMDLVKEALDGGHKVLIFSQFTSMLDLLGDRLKKERIAYHRIDGSVKKEERIRMAESFALDSVPVFCISLKAGGTGLNLTAADIVIHYDPWWNQAAQNQASDRTHRIGQKHVVTVYQLIAAGSIEENIIKLQKSKSRLAEDVLSGEGIQDTRIDREQILALLGE